MELLVKRKYTRDEVKLMLEKAESEFKAAKAEQENRVRELIKENNILKAELDELNGKERLIVATLERAEKTAMDVEKNAEIRYAIELERIKNFTARWNGYFQYIKEKYPTQPAVKKALKVKEIAEKATSKGDAKNAIGEIDDMLGGKPPFDPKQKIKDYIAATEDKGFDLDEVLHPGQLKLEEICRELGLIEEKE